ncbi:MAG: membrane integrity-associated transporter subunit PqiC [Bacteroidota bacterium]
MTPILPRLAALTLIAALAGCGASTPLRYHALSTSGPANLAQGSAAALVEVLPIAVPERVNREEVVLIGNGGQVDVRSGDRWAAPLADEMRQLVDDALWRRLRAADVYSAPVTPNANGLAQYRLALRMERLEALAGRQAVAEATWTLRKLPQGQPAICRAAAAEPLAATTPDAAVAALSRASARVAEAVAASVERLHQGGATPCES